MPKVPEYNNKQIHRIYTASEEPISLKQKNLIAVLHERRKLPKPDFTGMTKKTASERISALMDDKFYEKH